MCALLDDLAVLHYVALGLSRSVIPGCAAVPPVIGRQSRWARPKNPIRFSRFGSQPAEELSGLQHSLARAVRVDGPFLGAPKQRLVSGAQRFSYKCTCCSDLVRCDAVISFLSILRASVPIRFGGKLAPHCKTRH